MYYIVYKVTNLINGKIYIGSHKTKKADDKYMGSGKILISAQKKYGIENFKKEILFIFDNPGEMYAKEAEIVNEDFLIDTNTYNLKLGGLGGWEYMNSLPKEKRYGFHKNLDLAKTAGALGDKICREKNIGRYSNESKVKAKQKLRERYPNGTFYGKSHTEETKRKMSDANSEKSKGERNSQFGTMWITDGTQNKKIHKTADIPENWYKGRVIKLK